LSIAYHQPLHRRGRFRFLLWRRRSTWNRSNKNQ